MLFINLYDYGINIYWSKCSKHVIHIIDFIAELTLFFFLMLWLFYDMAMSHFMQLYRALYTVLYRKKTFSFLLGNINSNYNFPIVLLAKYQNNEVDFFLLQIQKIMHSKITMSVNNLRKASLQCSQIYELLILMVCQYIDNRCVQIQICFIDPKGKLNNVYDNITWVKTFVFNLTQLWC